MDKWSDEALARAVQDGNKAAFGELVTRYQKQIFSLAYRLTNNPEEALDLSQEVFLRLYEVIGKWDRSRPFFPWMYKVAVNVVNTALRQKHPDPVPLGDIIEFTPLLPPPGTQPEEYCEAKEMERLVQEAVSRLPDKYRLPLVLRYVGDLSYQRIAEVLEVPVSTVETRLYRGKVLLYKRLSLVLERGVQREVSRG
ncbi:MAG: sigma-70 family RNA polymerase sigma factor [Clostridia bacterium]|nr:sigma-70 family RNA polymerase sigma factor [Clostridia bacterium]